MMALISPYFGKTFFPVLVEFCHRFLLLITGKLSLSALASDELQIGVLILLSLSSALVGPFLVLRQMTMLANSLSHTILLGIVCTIPLFGPLFANEAMPASQLFIAALIAGLSTVVLTTLIEKSFRLQSDASIGIVFNGLFALGIILVTLISRSTCVGIEVVTGNIDALVPGDLFAVFKIFIFNGLLVLLAWKEYKAISFDAAHAKTVGIATRFFTYLLMVQTALTAMAGFRAVGILLVLAFLVCPVILARFFTKRLGTIVFLSALFGSLHSIIGVALTRHLFSVYSLRFSTSGMIVVLLGLSLSTTYFVSQASKRTRSPLRSS